ncbi:MAG: DUF1501 domain-containing protein [Planctomycetota bacterium]|nr:DUF1501 domain-containing protein [Planctomycetota bacterium]MDA1252492.1 DUF1501 domain-containing protein [Planctomycetota bacterium]
MNPLQQRLQNLTRRHFLRDCKIGLGGMAMASMLADESPAEQKIDPANPLLARDPHFPGTAKHVIYLHMAGSPPHLDLFDYKPELVRLNDQPCPDEYYDGKRFAFTSSRPTLLGTPQKFKQHGESGTWVSEALPNIAKVTDDIAVIKSVTTSQFNHAPAQMFLYTGSPQPGRPSMGSWVTYGLGSENANLPGFVALISGGVSPSGGKDLWGTGFLSSVFQGVQCRSQGEPVLYVSNPKGMNRDVRRLSLDALRDLNELQAQELGSPETRTRIAQYELAYRMQMSVPQAMDLTQEPKHVLDAYGAVPGNGSFNNNVLLARRLVEHGVRFVQLFDWGWDFHGTNASRGIREGLTSRCKPMDQAVGALITDLKERGLLDETLIVWGGEFGRTPFREGRTSKSNVLGRDHFPDCYSMFMAGGGIKPGISYGESDPLGFTPAVDKVHVHDLQATILHTLGLNHEKLTHRFQGRDYRLTDVHGEVVEGLLA